MRDRIRGILKVLDGQPSRVKGQGLVELALTTPLLILLILGVTEIGFLANNMLTLMDTVREASRRAVTLDPRSWTPGAARWGERMDCDFRNDAFSLTIGSPAAPNRDQANEWRGVNRLPGYVKTGTTTIVEGGVTKTLEIGDKPSFEFFDAVACYAISILSPLEFNDDETWGQDDIIVSVVSYITMDYSATGPYGPYNPAAKTGNPLETSHGSAIAASRQALISADPKNAYEVTVTGRWPLENRYCTSTNDGSGEFDDYRDPFDYNRINNLNYIITKVPVPNSAPAFRDPPPSVTNDTPHDTENELLERDAVGNLIPYKYVLAGTGQSQQVRGYVFSGKYRMPNGCWGSRFTVKSVEDLLNQQISASTQTQGDLRGKSTNGALVIVEMHWQYHPFFLGRIYGDIASAFARDRDPALTDEQDRALNDPVLYVYSMFSVSAAEPTATP
ncbi:MAG: pilus assembly protein [Anaerolineae bacterium]|nr:pilus assembly protein [Anaerolineae bacterium]